MYVPGVQAALVVKESWAMVVPAADAPAKLRRATSIGDEAPAFGESTGLKPLCAVIEVKLTQLSSKPAEKTAAPTFKPAGAPLVTDTAMVTDWPAVTLALSNASVAAVV